MRSALLFLLIALQVLDYSSYVVGYLDVNDYCQTSYGTIGLCLPVEYCPGASNCYMEICSYVGGNLIICCEHLEHVEEDEGGASIKSGTGEINANQNNAEYCLTDYGAQGECVSMNECPSAQESLRRFIFPKICQYNDVTPMVCCARSDDESDDLETRGPIDNAESCQTDSGRRGTCLSIKQCPGAQVTRGNRLTLCRMEGSEPIVCCEESAQIQTRFPELRTNGQALRKCQEYRKAREPSKSMDGRTALFAIGSENAPPIGGGAVGGENANRFEFPHLAVLGYEKDNNIHWACGGSLISEKFVLTAAHCIRTLYGRVRRIALGAYQISAIKDNLVQLFDVKNTISHPNYKFRFIYNDIALIELDREVKFERGVYPACLNTKREIPTEFRFTAAGWGATELYGPPSDILQKVSLRLVSFNNCSRYYRQKKKLPNGLDDYSQICADGGGKRMDTCQGDSGGPLQIPGPVKPATIVGITSFGEKCALVPGVYTRVSNYIPWIESEVWSN